MADPAWLKRLRARVDGRAVSLDGVLAGLVEGAAAQAGADRATLFLVDRGRGRLVPHVASPPGSLPVVLDAAEGIAGAAATSGRPVVVPDTAADPRFSPRADGVTGFTTRSLAAVPIPDGAGATLAVLEVVDASPGAFGEADLPALVALAAEVGAVLAGTSLPAQLAPGATRAPRWRYNLVVGSSPAMDAVLDRVGRAAATDATVLVRGESGTGKELLARALHDNSRRAEGPFVKVDCAALPEALVENELFGHEQGAFTGADRAAPGKVAAAQGGTLFLDEVAELSPSAQARLLRLVQERTWTRVGGTREERGDVRIVAATHRPLEEMVRDGRLRADLYWRLRVVELHLPPLRDRGPEDLDRLVDHFLYTFGRRHGRALPLSAAARARLHGHAWAGNVRELEHVIEAAVVLAPGEAILPDDLPLAPPLSAPSAADVPSPAPGPSGPIRPLAEVERDYAAWAVRACGGNRAEAARRLGIGRNTLARKLAGDPTAGD